jgi:hypothetical protein
MMSATITPPTAEGWEPKKLLLDVLGVRQQAILGGHRGPFAILMGSAWRPYLRQEWSQRMRHYHGRFTVRMRLEEIGEVAGVAVSWTLPRWDVRVYQLVAEGSS